MVGLQLITLRWVYLKHRTLDPYLFEALNSILINLQRRSWIARSMLELSLLGILIEAFAMHKSRLCHPAASCQSSVVKPDVMLGRLSSATELCCSSSTHLVWGGFCMQRWVTSRFERCVGGVGSDSCPSRVIASWRFVGSW